MTDFTPEELEDARVLFARPATFVMGAAKIEQLIDSRHGLKKVDDEALEALDLAAVSYQIILTKADKLKKGEAEAVQAATLKAISKRPAAFPAVLVTSAEKGDGLPELRAEIMRTTNITP